MSILGDGAFRPVRAVNAAVIDSVMTAVAEGVEKESLVQPKKFASAYEHLMSDAEYRAAIERATAREENVATRLEKARHYLLR